MSYILEAHRGVSSEYPENTMSAFRAAYELGYGMIELDTKFTADQKCVILHDRTLNRTGRGPGASVLSEEIRIDCVTFEEARRYDFGVWKGERFRGEKIPSLEEVLAFSKETGIPLKFDNVVQSHTPEQRKIFFDTIEGMGMRDAAGFTGSDMSYIREVIGRFPGAYIHYDGGTSESALDELASVVRPGRLAVWMRYDNRITSWNGNAPVDAASAALVRRRAALGVWLLTDERELETAAGEYHADIIETDGSIKPSAR